MRSVRKKKEGNHMKLKRLMLCLSTLVLSTSAMLTACNSKGSGEELTRVKKIVAEAEKMSREGLAKKQRKTATKKPPKKSVTRHSTGMLHLAVVVRLKTNSLKNSTKLDHLALKKSLLIKSITKQQSMVRSTHS